MKNAILALSALLLSPISHADSAPPKVFIDAGACPTECCTYREWTVEKNTPLYDKVNGKKKVGEAKKGTKVTGETGEVHTVPLKMKTADDTDFYLLTYQGEDVWKIWQDGEVTTGEKNWEGDKRPESTWWVQIKLPTGVLGWTKESNNFGNINACGDKQEE